MLLERNRELAEIDACIAAAAAERGSFLVLEGRSGMGKSALLTEVRERAAAAGFTTLSAVGSDLEREFAFGVVRQLFELAIRNLSKEDRALILEGAAALAEPLLGSGGHRVAPDQFAALHGLYWLAANLAVRTPLLVAVDDAHWADVASLRWLAYLLNRLEGLPTLVAIATRSSSSDPQGEVLAAILAHSRVRVLRVGPLGESSTAALVRTRFRAEPDPDFTAACLRVTAGNPLVLNELLRELQAGGAGPTSASTVDLEKRAPDAIARRVHRDLSLLGTEAGRLAAAVAVIGDRTELHVTARLANLGADRAAEAADALLAADIFASQRPPRFGHPLLRAAVYDHVPAGTRQEMHRRAAQILRSQGADLEAVAAHLLRCDAGESAETIECLRAAAPLALRRGAPEVAVSYLRRALAEHTDAAQRTAVLAELGRAEVSAGDVAATEHLREALTATADRRSRGTILCDLAAAVNAQSDERVSRDLLERALEEFRGCDEDAAARLECFVMGKRAGDPRVESSGGQRVAPLAIDYPRLRQLARSGTSNAELARVTLAYLISLRDGTREEALAWVGAGFSWSRLFKGRDLDATGIAWSQLALSQVDDPHRLAGWSDTIIREAAAEGYPLGVLNGLEGKAWAEFQLGQLAEAEADQTAALEMSQQYFPFWIPLVGAHLAAILFERGRQGAAYKAIEEVALGGILGAGIEAGIREIRGRLRCARGWRERGVVDLRASGRLCELHALLNPIMYPWRVSLAGALAQDDIAEARQLARENLTNARRSGIPRAIGIALCTLARLDDDDSVDLLRASVATLEEAPAPLDLARALIDLGTALRRRAYRVEAREPLREGLEIAARCGAVPLMERARAEATAAGARPRRARLRGVDALTPSELRVARLAAAGRSNREIAQSLFITAKTVADHLGSGYSKLGIESREQLATALERSNAS